MRSTSSSTEYMCVTVISFLVSVPRVFAMFVSVRPAAPAQRSELSDIPVLSEQITLTLPSASTLGSFLTIALRLDILKTPRASVTVVTIGRPSGMAATASDTGNGNEFRTHDFE